jgi:hypothetical protein
MKLNIVLPWLCVVGVSAGLASVYFKGAAKDADLAKLREENQQLQQAQTELEEIKGQVQLRQEEVANLRKDREELLRLRNENGKLREEKQVLTRQVTTAQSEIERAKAQVTEVRSSTQQLQNENLQLRSQATQGQQTMLVNACVNTLRQLDGAKQQWALEHNKTAEAVPVSQEVMPYLPNSAWPVCPSGGAYSLNALNQLPTCTVPGHALPRQ